jgi:hypothetical protein
MESFLQAELLSRPSLPELHTEGRQPLTRGDKGHLLAFLEDLKDHKHARLFLDQAHLNSLGLPRYPEIIKPTLDLGTVEKKLRKNKYHTTEDLIVDFKRIAENSRRQWEWLSHVMHAAKEAIQSSKKLLRAVEAFVKHLPALASQGIKPRQLLRRHLQPTVTLNGLNNEHVERLTTKISQIEIMHRKNFLLPHDNQRPMQELSKVRKDIMGSNSRSLKEVRHTIDTLHDASESTNGSQHRITSLIREALELVNTLSKEAIPEAEGLEHQGLPDEQMLNSPEPLATPDEPPSTKKDKYIKQQQEKYPAGGYPPRNPWISEEDPPIYSYEDCLQVKAMTIELLQTVRKVSLNFCDAVDRLDTVAVDPPLHALIGFSHWRNASVQIRYTRNRSNSTTQVSHTCLS